MSPKIVELPAGPDGFTDDKDAAKKIRETTIIPALEAHDEIVLDFCKVKSSTQSFVHALVGEALQRFKEPALEKIQFKGCTPLMKGLVQLVVDYSLGGFRLEHSEVNDKVTKGIEVPTPKPKRRGNSHGQRQRKKLE
ncbi:MAG: STAS-like domain-containing protein [Candidatus Acidiferrum sp.]